jgi:hypothetical protein
MPTLRTSPIHDEWPRFGETDRIGHGEASPAPLAASTLTRAQVVAETREAQRLGLPQSNEAGVRIATSAELESARQAGLRAVETTFARSAQ